MNVDVVNELRVVRERARNENVAQEVERARQMAEASKRKDRKTEMMRSLCPATLSDYRNWLEGYIQNGGRITHVYEYPMPNDFYRAIKDVEMIPLFGADAVHIIIPRGMKASGKDFGHCTLYFEEGYRARGGWIPLYSDINF